MRTVPADTEYVLNGTVFIEPYALASTKETVMISAWWWVLVFVGSGYLLVLLATLIPSKPRKVNDADAETAAEKHPAAHKWLPSYADDDTVINYNDGRANLLRPISPSEPYSTTLGPL